MRGILLIFFFIIKWREEIRRIFSGVWAFDEIVKKFFETKIDW